MKTNPFCKNILYPSAFLCNQLISLINPIGLISLINPISPISPISRIGLISPISLIILHPPRSCVIKTMCAPTKGCILCKQVLKST